MQIGIFSDCHCGYKYGEERGEDSFIALDEAIEKTLDCDLILIAGDLFDSRIPRQEVFAKTARILSKAQHFPSNTKFLDIINKDKKEISPLSLRGVPIIAIHGTHERRSKYVVNPVQALEHAGLLIHLDSSTILFEINDKKIAVHGMSGVPEKYAKDHLKQWNPKPVEGATNILMIHQNIDPYIYSPSEPCMKLDDLPKGFDLYVLGHMHWKDIKDLNGGKLLLCGSTVPTTVHRIESEQKKYIYKYSDVIRSFPLEKQREIIWKEYPFSPGIRDDVENFLLTIPKNDPKSLVYIKIKGKIPKDSVRPNFVNVENKFKNKINVERKEIISKRAWVKNIAREIKRI
jgi:DNA repair exonuclease SbcCD nuclease subunit